MYVMGPKLIHLKNHYQTRLYIGKIQVHGNKVKDQT